MSLGPLVRRSFGRFERPAVELYRSMFVNLEAFVRSIRATAGSPERVLEIGCGDGVVTERLAAVFPDAQVTGIDVCAQPGRLSRPAGPDVRFLKLSAPELWAQRPDPFQLIVLCDVLHHVPLPERRELLACAAKLVAANGVLVLKEWVRQRTPAYLMGYCADRFITGDDAHYLSERELHAIASDVFGAGSIRSQFRVPPWDCNLAVVISPALGV